MKYYITISKYQIFKNNNKNKYQLPKYETYKYLKDFYPIYSMLTKGTSECCIEYPIQGQGKDEP